MEKPRNGLEINAKRRGARQKLRRVTANQAYIRTVGWGLWTPKDYVLNLTLRISYRLQRGNKGGTHHQTNLITKGYTTACKLQVHATTPRKILRTTAGVVVSLFNGRNASGVRVGGKFCKCFFTAVAGVLTAPTEDLRGRANDRRRLDR